MAKETDMDKQIEQLRSSWENEEFQKKQETLLYARYGN